MDIVMSFYRGPLIGLLWATIVTSYNVRINFNPGTFRSYPKSRPCYYQYKTMMLSELKRDVEAIEERLTKVGEYL